jgi:hypothetical protein
MAERIVASPATGTEVLYRVVSVGGAAIDDFRGRRDLPRTRPLAPDTPGCYWPASRCSTPRPQRCGSLSGDRQGWLACV